MRSFPQVPDVHFFIDQLFNYLKRSELIVKLKIL